MNTFDFFKYLSFSLSEATSKIQKFSKEKNPEERLWRELHRELTHSCARMTEIQYEYIDSQKSSRKN